MFVDHVMSRHPYGCCLLVSVRSMFSAAGHVHRGQWRGGHLGVVREEGVEEGEDRGDGERFGESPPSASDRADEEERRLTFAADF